MKKLLLLTCLAIFSLASLAQKAPLTDGKARLKAMEEQHQLFQKSAHKDLHWQFLG